MLKHHIPSQQMKTVCVSPQSKLNEDIAKSIDKLFAMTSPCQYRDVLIEIYSSYLVHEHQSLPVDFGNVAMRMKAMLEFLASCEE